MTEFAFLIGVWLYLLGDLSHCSDGWDRGTLKEQMFDITGSELVVACCCNLALLKTFNNSPLMSSFIDSGTFLNSGTKESINRVSSSFVSGSLVDPCNNLSFKTVNSFSSSNGSFFNDLLQILFCAMTGALSSAGTSVSPSVDCIFSTSSRLILFGFTTVLRNLSWSK